MISLILSIPPAYFQLDLECSLLSGTFSEAIMRKCIIKQRAKVNVSMAFFFTYMMYFLKWAVSSTFKLLSFVF